MLRMLSQDFVLALLQASITGAGLVLAIYTLILPLSRRFLEERARRTIESLERLKQKVAETKIESKIDAEKIEGLVKEVQTWQTYPVYLSLGIAVTFFGYIASALMSVGWILSEDRASTFYDQWLSLVFVGSTFLFLIIGILSINDISQTMKREFEKFKKEIAKPEPQGTFG